MNPIEEIKVIVTLFLDSDLGNPKRKYLIAEIEDKDHILISPSKLTKYDPLYSRIIFNDGGWYVQNLSELHRVIIRNIFPYSDKNIILSLTYDTRQGIFHYQDTKLAQNSIAIQFKSFDQLAEYYHYYKLNNIPTLSSLAIIKTIQSNQDNKENEQHLFDKINGINLRVKPFKIERGDLTLINPQKAIDLLIDENSTVQIERSITFNSWDLFVYFYNSNWINPYEYLSLSLAYGRPPFIVFERLNSIIINYEIQLDSRKMKEIRISNSYKIFDFFHFLVERYLLGDFSEERYQKLISYYSEYLEDDYLFIIDSQLLYGSLIDDNIELYENKKHLLQEEDLSNFYYKLLGSGCTKILKSVWEADFSQDKLKVVLGSEGILGNTKESRLFPFTQYHYSKDQLQIKSYEFFDYLDNQQPLEERLQFTRYFLDVISPSFNLTDSAQHNTLNLMVILYTYLRLSEINDLLEDEVYQQIRNLFGNNHPLIKDSELTDDDYDDSIYWTLKTLSPLFTIRLDEIRERIFNQTIARIYSNSHEIPSDPLFKGTILIILK